MGWHEEAQAHDRAMHIALDAGDWEEAIRRARVIPKNWSPFDRFPEHQIPPEAMNQVLDAVPKSDSGNFLFELAHKLHPDLKHEHLRRIGEMGLDDHTVQDAVLSHPNWSPSSEESGAHIAGKFWNSYERKVMPHHFAAVKSLYSGNPETIKDHRGRVGSSHQSYITDEKGAVLDDPEGFKRASTGESRDIPIQSALRFLPAHAKRVQAAILKDPWTRRNIRYMNGKPHIQLFRGVGGDYGKRLLDAAKFDPRDYSVTEKRLRIPITEMASWTTDPETARRFAIGRGDIGDQAKDAGVVISAYHPVESILHSGFHKVHVGQEHKHPGESEIIVGHPKGHVTVHTRNIEVQKPLADTPVHPDMTKPSLRPRSSKPRHSTPRMSRRKAA